MKYTDVRRGGLWSLQPSSAASSVTATHISHKVHSRSPNSDNVVAVILTEVEIFSFPVFINSNTSENKGNSMTTNNSCNSN